MLENASNFNVLDIKKKQSNNKNNKKLEKFFSTLIEVLYNNLINNFPNLKAADKALLKNNTKDFSGILTDLQG